MDLGIVLRGLVLGFSIAAPVGPIGVLCIQRTLTRGLLYGLAAGLGAATADAIYGGVAGFGLTLVSDFFVSQGFWLRLLGGLFLCYLGLKTLCAAPSTSAAEAGGSGVLGVYAATLLLTLTNPMTILSFAAIFAGLGVDNLDSHIGAALLVLGVFIGSALWWLLLSGGVSLLRERIKPDLLRWVNRLSGGVIVGFGVVVVGSVVLG
jgi:threonine/homoserine/homoserine lactone efflux protein